VTVHPAILVRRHERILRGHGGRHSGHGVCRLCPDLLSPAYYQDQPLALLLQFHGRVLLFLAQATWLPQGGSISTADSECSAPFSPGDMLVFAALARTGLHYRRRPDVHKRLMTLATIALLAAPIARLPLPFVRGPLANFGLADLFIVACLVCDLVTRGRIHHATLLGGLAVVASQPLRLMVLGHGRLARARHLDDSLTCR
jgi:hypothetical protein